MSWTLTKEIYTPKDDWGQDIVLEGIRRFIKEILDEIEKREKESIEEMINKGLTSKERDMLHKEIKTKLTDFIKELAGRGVMKVYEREKRKQGKTKQKSISKGIK